MASFRDFWLVNSLNQEYRLADQKTRVFFNSPSGLGFSKNYDVQKIGNSEIIIDEQLILPDVTGEMVFYNDTVGDMYNEYTNFINFISHTPITLHYKIPSDLTDYYSDVLITRLDKSEVDESKNYMSCPITFHRLTEWLTNDDYVIILTNTTSDIGKYYYDDDESTADNIGLLRPYHYAGSDLSQTTIYNNGTNDVGFQISINGEIQNPQFTLTQNGKQYGVCKINGTYDYVMVNSFERDEQIYLERNGSVISSPEQYQDFTVADGESLLTWTKFKVGESIFSFNAGNIDVFSGYIEIRFKKSFISI